MFRQSSGDPRTVVSDQRWIVAWAAAAMTP
jgi:hypothetical protein